MPYVCIFVDVCKHFVFMFICTCVICMCVYVGGEREQYTRGELSLQSLIISRQLSQQLLLGGVSAGPALSSARFLCFSTAAHAHHVSSYSAGCPELRLPAAVCSF